MKKLFIMKNTIAGINKRLSSDFMNNPLGFLKLEQKPVTTKKAGIKNGTYNFSKYSKSFGIISYDRINPKIWCATTNRINIPLMTSI